MTDLDPIAWLDQHPRLSKYVLYPTVTVGFWIAELLVTDHAWSAVLMAGIFLTTGVGLSVMLTRPCERFAAWLASLSVFRLAVGSMVVIRDTLISYGLWKHTRSKGKHAWNYMSWNNPVNVYTLQARLARK